MREITVKDLLDRGAEKAFELLSYRPRAEKEIRFRLERYFRRFLKRRKFDLAEYQAKVDEAIEKVLSGLKKGKMVDDRRFVAWWLDQRVRFRPRSKREITTELLKKGVRMDLILTGLEKAGFDEEAAAKKLIEKKLRLSSLPAQGKAKKKLIEYLWRKGFSYSMVKKLIDEK